MTSFISESQDSITYSSASERAVLGAILVNNGLMDTVTDLKLKADDFYLEKYRKIFDTMGGLVLKSQPLDLLTVTGALRMSGDYDTIGGTATLTELFDEAFTLGNVDSYAKTIIAKSQLRQLSRACHEIATQINQGVEDQETFINDAEAKVFSVSEMNTTEKFSSIREGLTSVIQEIEDRAQRKTDIVGIELGFTELDKLTTGLLPGQILVIAARPGMGKTSFLISFVLHTAIKQNSTVAFFTMEMTKSEIFFRLLSCTTKINSKRLKLGKLADREWLTLNHACGVLAKANIHVDDSGGLTVMEIRARCRRLRREQKKLDLVVIDYLQLMRGSSRMQRGVPNPVQEISEISQNLKELAKELKVPIVVLSQLNRAGAGDSGAEGSAVKRPVLNNLRGSGSIEQDADMVAFLHREEYYKKEGTEAELRGIAEFIIGKNRHGEQGTVFMEWQGQYMLFSDLPEGHPLKTKGHENH